jgi:hypothetical protein
MQSRAYRALATMKRLTFTGLMTSFRVDRCVRRVELADTLTIEP